MKNNTNQVPIHEVQYLENNLTEQEIAQQWVQQQWFNPQAKFNNDIEVRCSYWNCPWPSSVPFEIEIYLEGNRRWGRVPNYGTDLPGCWKQSFTGKYYWRDDLWLTHMGHAQDVIPLLNNDRVYTVNCFGKHCVEDSDFCNAALKIIRECIRHHEYGGEVKVNETLDSDFYKWTKFGFKIGATAGTFFINPATSMAIGASAWGAGKMCQEICESKRGKEFWGTVSGIGVDTFKGGVIGSAFQGAGAIIGSTSRAGLNSKPAVEAARQVIQKYQVGGMSESAFVNMIAETGAARASAAALRGAQIAGEIDKLTSIFKELGFSGWEAKVHIEHVNRGFDHDSNCKICTA